MSRYIVPKKKKIIIEKEVNNIIEICRKGNGDFLKMFDNAENHYSVKTRCCGTNKNGKRCKLLVKSSKLFDSKNFCHIHFDQDDNEGTRKTNYSAIISINNNECKYELKNIVKSKLVKKKDFNLDEYFVSSSYYNDFDFFSLSIDEKTDVRFYFVVIEGKMDKHTFIKPNIEDKINIYMEKIKNNVEKGDCEICLEENIDLHSLPCNSKHKMCKTCISGTYKVKSLCPFCRSPNKDLEISPLEQKKFECPNYDIMYMDNYYDFYSKSILIHNIDNCDDWFRLNVLYSNVELYGLLKKIVDNGLFIHKREGEYWYSNDFIDVSILQYYLSDEEKSVTKGIFVSYLESYGVL